MSSNIFGVKLRNRKSSQNVPAKPARGLNLSGHLSHKRQSLRHVSPAKPKVKRVDSTGKKWLRKVAPSPFTIRQSPLFGVVLKTQPKKTLDNSDKEQQEPTESTTDTEMEQFLDLDFRDRKFKRGSKTTHLDMQTGQANETILDEKPVAPFGVRLKPVRKHTNLPPDPSKTYQIDLNPVKGRPGGTYQPTSKSFLEVKLKPVKRAVKPGDTDTDATPEFVELRLRHVVAPEDGGPERTVTEACFQIPLPQLRQVPVDELRRPGDGHVAKHDPLEELLQLTIESLNHVVPQKRELPAAQHNIRFQLRATDNPQSRDFQPLTHCIDIQLRNTPRSIHAKERQVPSMQVQLRPVHRDGTVRQDEQEPEFANVQLKHVRVTEEEELLEIVDEADKVEGEEYEEIEIADEFDEEELPDDDDEYVEEEIEEDMDDSRKSLPDLHLNEMDIKDPDDDDVNNKQLEEQEPAEEKPAPVEPEAPPAKETTKEDENKDDDGKREGRGSRRKPPRRMRSSSLSEVDRLRRRRQQYIELKANQSKEEPKRELTQKQRRDLLMWYNRMKTPNKEDMKRRVAKLPPSCDITPEDVELLPWLCKGRFLDLRVMNQYFLEDWQGTDEVKKDDSDDE